MNEWTIIRDIQFVSKEAYLLLLLENQTFDCVPSNKSFPENTFSIRVNPFVYPYPYPYPGI